MDGIQDALEEAQYLYALHGGRWEVTNPLPDIDDEERKVYIRKMQMRDQDAFSMGSICRECLGFYLFRIFLKDHGFEDEANYFYESSMLQTLTSQRSIIENARYIVGKYLLDDSPRRYRCHEQVDPQPSLCRMMRSDGRMLHNNVSIHHRHSDGSLQFRGKLVDDILEIVGISEKPLGRDFQIDTNELKTLLARLDEEVFAVVEYQSGVLFEESSQFRLYIQVKVILTMRPLSEDNFAKIRILGRGGFGRVYACRNVMTGKVYALKVIDKKRVKYKHAEKMCLIERETLEKISSPFNMSLKYAFADSTNLYLVLDLMIGGDLSYHLQQIGSFSMEQTKYYAARIVCALAVLHRNHYIYRDLKPENVLLDHEGRSKLSDFGLACKVDEKGYVSGVCGTRGYWAPEMHVNRIEEHHSPMLQSRPTTSSIHILQTTASATTTTDTSISPQQHQSSGKKIHCSKPVYSYSVDWFSLGCCIYEFLIGESPFRTDRAKNWGAAVPSTTSKSFASIFSRKQQSTKVDRDENLESALQEMEPDLDLLDEYRSMISYRHQQLHQSKCQELSSTTKCQDSLMSSNKNEVHGRNSNKQTFDVQSCGSNESKEESKLLDRDIENVKDLLRKLLQKDPINRLGSGGSRYGRDPLGYREIQAHPWFASIDWTSLQAMAPPFVPTVDHSNAMSSSEIGDFEDEDFINQTIKEVDNSIYCSWDYISLEDAEEEIVELLMHRENSKGENRSVYANDCCCLS